jgi:hypothetical protein
MRLTFAVLLCSLAAPAFAAPDVNSANFILPHCRAAQQPDKPPGFMTAYRRTTRCWVADIAPIDKSLVSDQFLAVRAN